MSQNVYSQDEIRGIFTKAGFRIINLESSVKKYTFPDFSSLLSNYNNFNFNFNLFLDKKLLHQWILVICNCLRLIPNY